MATRRSHRPSADTAERPATDPPEPLEDSAPAGHEVNGATAEAATEAAATGAQPVIQRAEEAADRLGERVRHYASIIGLKILRFAARVKEEAEDIWAEAQSIRRGGPPPQA
jgi:hypothetical protein